MQNATATEDGNRPKPVLFRALPLKTVASGNQPPIFLALDAVQDRFIPLPTFADRAIALPPPAYVAGLGGASFAPPRAFS